MSHMPLLCSILFAALQPVVPIPPGETALAEIGIYRVHWQSYGGEAGQMPPGWTGHFEPATGISYLPNEQIMGRPAMLIHSPWHVPAGATWVDYPLEFPDITPIRLRFGITMRADIALPDKSDGSTFSCRVVPEGGEPQQLLREHYALGQWKNFDFDLSAYAGKQITLRLQIEPGPANSPSWDYSYFGNPVLAVGTELSPAVDIEALLQAPAVQAVAGVSLAPLSNASDTGVTPSNLLEHANIITRAGDTWEFCYEGADVSLRYLYTPKTGTLDDLVVAVGDAAPFQPAAGGGVFMERKRADRTESVLLGDGVIENIWQPEGAKHLDALWNYPTETGRIAVRWRFGIRGKALTVSAESDDTSVSLMSLGREGDIPFRKSFPVPYLMGSITYLPAQRLYTFRYFDWTKSHATSSPEGQAFYRPNTAGVRNALHEEGFIAISPNVLEVLPNIPHPPSPYIEELGPRIMLDLWDHHKGTYLGDAEHLRDLKDNGVDHLAIIQHVWQRYGYDVKLPDHLPANPQFGTEDDLADFGRAARECGYLWSLHENYIDLYPDAPSYDATARVLREDGSPSPGWFNAGTGVQSFGIKCTRSLGFAQANSPEIHARYGTTAAYLDVHTCVPPWHQVDHDAAQPVWAMALDKVNRDTALFQYERDTHGGPLFGEGNQHFFWAGRFDGAEAQVAGGEDHLPLLDFDLLKIHPQMVNHGMGYYERWFRRGYDLRWGADAGTVKQVDQYRAQEIAYGHAGFIGNPQTRNIQWVAKEHHMMHPIQRLMNTAKPTQILYEVNGKLAPLSVALAAGQRLRQHIAYDSGLKLWINWAQDTWQVEGRMLPQWGVLALGPDTRVETSLQGDLIADYAECPEFLFADARTSFNMPYLNSTKKIEPRLKTFEHTGGGNFRLAYEWRINDTLDKDCVAFVHFTEPGITTGNDIRFQQDHPLPKPTSQWSVGETLIDGPYELTLPENPLSEYNIVIGLYKDGTVPLEGPAISANRILIGKLEVQSENGVVTGVRLGDIAPQVAAIQQTQADFSERLNPAGSWVDFGAVATNGSVKINKGERQLDIFPYPRDKAFTVSLDLARILPQSVIPMNTVRITAIEALSLQPLGPVECNLRDGRVIFETARTDAGRYRVTW